MQHGDCDHSDEMQHFFLDFSKRIQNWGLQNTPLFPLAKKLTHRQIQTIAGPSSGSMCYTSLALSVSTASSRYCSATTRLIPSRYRTRQVFDLSNFNDIGDSHSSPTRWLPNFRRLYTAHPKPSLLCIACLLPPNNHNIICLL